MINRQEEFSESITSEIVKISYGMRFPPYKNYISYGVLLFFIIAMLVPTDSNVSIVVIPLCILVFLIMISATNGVVIDRHNNKYKYYFSVFGLSVGRWKKWIGYSCFVLKSSRKKQDRRLTRDFIDRESSIKRFMTTELYMMNSSHRKKILCGSFDTLNEAKLKLTELKKTFNFPIQKFSPKRTLRR